MKIQLNKDQKWVVNKTLKQFTDKQILEVGVDVPRDIANDMITCGYAAVLEEKANHTKLEDKSLKMNLEDKINDSAKTESEIPLDAPTTKIPIAKEEKDRIIWSIQNMSKSELLKFAKDNQIMNVTVFNKKDTILKRILLSLEEIK